MYRQTRIPRLRASLWVSVPDKAHSLADAASSAEAHSLADAASSAEAADPDRGNTAAGLASGPTVAPAAAPSLIVPDGCMDLIVIDSQILIAGADSTARMFHGSAVPTVGLRFDSGVLPQLLTTAAGELADHVTPLGAVIGGRHAGARNVGEGGVASVTGAARILLDTACGLMDRAVLDLRPMALARALDARSSSPAQTVTEAAAQFAYSPRQLRRLSAEWFGYGPKHLAKILRWQAARDLIDSGRSRTEAAAEVGYADAAHLRRDERSLIG